MRALRRSPRRRRDGGGLRQRRVFVPAPPATPTRTSAVRACERFAVLDCVRREVLLKENAPTDFRSGRPDGPSPRTSAPSGKSSSAARAMTQSFARAQRKTPGARVSTNSAAALASEHLASNSCSVRRSLWSIDSTSTGGWGRLPYARRAARRKKSFGGSFSFVERSTGDGESESSSSSDGQWLLGLGVGRASRGRAGAALSLPSFRSSNASSARSSFGVSRASPARAAATAARISRLSSAMVPCAARVALPRLPPLSRRHRCSPSRAASRCDGATRTQLRRSDRTRRARAVPKGALH